MTVFTLSSNEAAYVIGALCHAVANPNFGERDREIMLAIIDRLAAPLNLSDAVVQRIEKCRGAP